MVHIGLESSLLTPHSQLWEEVERPPTPTQFCTTPPSLHQEHPHAPHEVGRKKYLKQKQRRKQSAQKSTYCGQRKIPARLPFAQLAVSKSLKIYMLWSLAPLIVTIPSFVPFWYKIDRFKFVTDDLLILILIPFDTILSS